MPYKSSVELLRKCESIVDSCPEALFPYDSIKTRFVPQFSSGLMLDLIVSSHCAGKTIQIADPDNIAVPKLTAAYWNASDITDLDEQASVTIDVSDQLEPTASDYAYQHPAIHTLRGFFEKHDDNKIRAISSVLAGFAELPAVAIEPSVDDPQHITTYTFDAVTMAGFELGRAVDRNLKFPTQIQDLHPAVYGEGTINGTPYVVSLHSQSIHTGTAKPARGFDIGVETPDFGITAYMASDEPFEGVTVYDRNQSVLSHAEVLARAATLPFLDCTQLNGGEGHFSGQPAIRQLRHFLQGITTGSIQPPLID